MKVNILTLDATNWPGQYKFGDGVSFLQGRTSVIEMDHTQYNRISGILVGNAGAGYISYTVTDVSVVDFGAVGDGVTDDTTAIQNAINFVRSIGGGTVHFPKPSVCYRVTGQILVGQRWVDEQYVRWIAGTGQVDLTTTTGYDGTKRDNLNTEPLVSIEAENGTDLWGDFAPSTDTAILYYGIGNGQGQGSRPRISGLQIVGQNGYSGGVPVFPSGTSTLTSNQIGLFLASASRVTVERNRFRELNRGIVSTDSYWSRIVSNETFRTNRAMELHVHNAATVQDNVASYSLDVAYLVTCQGGRLKGNDTEGAVVSIWIPQADQVSIDGGYLESNGSSPFNGYEVVFGDPGLSSTTQVVWGHISNVHGYREAGGHLYLKGAQVSAHNVRMYQTTGASLTLLADSSAALAKEQCNLPIDPASSGTVESHDLSGPLQVSQGIATPNGNRDSSNINQPSSGLQLGRLGIACDPSTIIAGFYQDAHTDDHFRFKLDSGHFATDGGRDYALTHTTSNLTLDDSHYVIHADASSGDITLTLPLISAVGSGRVYKIRRLDTSTVHAVHIASQSGNAIENGAVPTNLSINPGQSLMLIADGAPSRWIIHSGSRWATTLAFPVPAATGAGATSHVDITWTPFSGEALTVGTPVTAAFCDPSSSLGIVDGIVVHARCIILGEIRVFFTNTTGSTWGDGSTSTCVTLSALITQ